MPHLITTSGSRIPLRLGEGYVIGRGRECDIAVEDLSCSRRHALLTLEDSGECFVEDLSSRNGTFLNGEAVMGRGAVRQASRIRVGATVYLVELVEIAKTADMADTGTMGFDMPLGAGELEGGELSRCGILELLKVLMAAKRDVSLHVALDSENAQVELRAGEVVAASCGGLDGFNALVKLGRANTGIFWVVLCDDDVDRNVQEPPKHLLIELSRCLGSATPPSK